MSRSSTHVTAVVLDVNGCVEYELSGQLKAMPLRKYAFSCFAVTWQKIRQSVAFYASVRKENNNYNDRKCLSYVDIQFL